ncbi:MAG: hypothetical protein ACM3SY_18495 [Candidatus Omnitrophota bacterium]
MKYALKERIGSPDLFTGRKEELAYFLKWIDGIKKEKSKSTAILARRKMGKTALMERLFNIVFDQNNGVIPFYYEIKETNMWIGDFCKDFFLTFIYQYIAFKTRNPKYLDSTEGYDFQHVIDMVKKEDLHYLTELIKGVEHEYKNEYVDTLWTLVRDAPRKLAAQQNEFIVQMIDEFQFLNSEIYWDKKKKNLADTMAGGYLSTAESKIAPLLVSGSWVGWLMNLLLMMLPARFKFRYLQNMPEDEAIEMIFNYSLYFEVPVTDETAYFIAQLTEGSPFYISAILGSECPGKDLTDSEGLIRTLEFETLNDWGEIKSTWMTYVASAFSRVNDKNAKNIVLYLSKHRDREFTRKELLDDLPLDMTDVELEKRLKALVKADIIRQGSTNFDYRGVQDNIFDKVFRSVYQKEIEYFDPEQIRKEYQEALTNLKKKYNQLQGKFNYFKGNFAEHAIEEQLRFHGRERNALLKSITQFLPTDFNFCEYERVWKYSAAIDHARGVSADILAQAKLPGDYSIIIEVKNRETRSFSKEEAAEFVDKFQRIKEKENLNPAIGFVFSIKGFTKDAEDYLKEKGMAISSDERWLGI